MHKQDNTTTDKGLDTIMESMYAAAAKEPLSQKTNTAKCDHCGGAGKHDDGSNCPKCDGTGEILLGAGKLSGEPYATSGAMIKFTRDAVEDSEEGDSDIDHHNQYMMDKDLLNPLHAAAQKAGADNIEDWMIKQIKQQGEEWIQTFIQDVISPGME